MVEGYKWKWCNVCQTTYVSCLQCGLNVCGGGSRCDKCEEAYEYWQSHEPPEGEELEKLKRAERQEYEKAISECPPEERYLIELFSGRGCPEE